MQAEELSKRAPWTPTVGFSSTKPNIQSVVVLCVFTFWVPCCDVRYDIRIKTMFGSYLPPVVCRRAHDSFTLFVFAYAECTWCPAHYVLCFLFCLFSSFVLLTDCFSEFSILDCTLGFPNFFFNTITFYFLRILYQSIVSIFITEIKTQCDA